VAGLDKASELAGVVSALAGLGLAVYGGVSARKELAGIGPPQDWADLLKGWTFPCLWT